jgi:hypothetical protein
MKNLKSVAKFAEVHRKSCGHVGRRRGRASQDKDTVISSATEAAI